MEWNDVDDGGMREGMEWNDVDDGGMREGMREGGCEQLYHNTIDTKQGPPPPPRSAAGNCFMDSASLPTDL